MICGEKLGGLPSVQRVTSLALATIHSPSELPSVGIGFMAIRAERVCDRSLEIRAFVAGIAGYLQVFASQSKLGFGVIELASE